MLNIRSSADLARALQSPLHPELRGLLAERRDQLLDGDVDIGDLVQFVLVQRGDRLADVERAVGLPLAGDETAIEWVQRHPGHWLEAVIITDDDGFAVVVFVRDCVLTDPDLLLALLAHA